MWLGAALSRWYPVCDFIPSLLQHFLRSAGALSLRSSNLTGTIPTEVGLMTSLSKSRQNMYNEYSVLLPLKLISDSFAVCTGDLILKGNSLTGNIPSEIGFTDMSKLH